MGKKSREKRERKDKKDKANMVEALLSPEAQDELKKITGSGDLRLLPAHIEHFLAGNDQARLAMRALGRDAAVPVMRAAQELKNAELEEFAQKLFATKPAVETNLMIMREISVMERVEARRGKVPSLDGAEVTVRGTQAALFDPALHARSLARGGRPRSEPEALGRGDIAWFVLEPDEVMQLRLHVEAVPEGALLLRLKVSSGLVFVGSPEASDGPRLGELRLDPFHTRFDEHTELGTWLALDPGTYAVGGVRTGPGQARLSFARLPDSAPPAQIDLGALALP